MTTNDDEYKRASQEPHDELSDTAALHPRIKARRVLALKGSPRLAEFLSQPFGRTFEVHPAVDGRGERAAVLHADFSHDLCAQLTGCHASGPEMGCALGHAQMISIFADDEGSPDDLLLVAEDDARLGMDFSAAINHIIENTPTLEYMILADPFGQAGYTPRFGHSRNSLSLPWTAPRFRAPSGITYRWGNAVGDYYGTGLYLVSRHAARKFARLLARHARVHWIADDYRYWAAEADIQLHYVRPNLASWEGESTVQKQAASQYQARHDKKWLMAAKILRSVIRQGLRGASATVNDVWSRVQSLKQ